MEYMNLFKDEEQNKPLPFRFTGDILSRDVIVARVEQNEVFIIDSTRCPLYLLRTFDFLGWLRTRSIDIHRTNSRILRKVLRINTSDEERIVAEVHAASITDTYWIRSDEEKYLIFDDVRFKRNYFTRVALYGVYEGYDIEDKRTPDLTTIGSYEKSWQLYDGVWHLLKRGSPAEIFSEMCAYCLGTALGFRMAEYKYKDDNIVSKDFTNNGNLCFEPMFSLIGEESENYELNYHTLESIDVTLARAYLDILYLDAIVMNVDRHTFNYGILRDSWTGDIISLAPNFDNNLSLISRDYPSNKAHEFFMSDIRDFLIEKRYVPNYISKFDMPSVLYPCLPSQVKDSDISFIIDFCKHGFDYMIGHI